MIKAILILLSIGVLTTSCFSQFPIVENFNPPMAWSTTNGAGVQFYGGTEYYATTNVGTTPYPNSSNITITSPVYNLTSCSSLLSVSFPLQGRVENGFDFLRFQYRIDAGPWTTVQSYTGFQNTVYTYTTIPTTATQFRFLLQTDATVNTYTTFPPLTTNVYYYDIASFTINCSVPLGVSEQLVISGEINRSGTAAITYSNYSSFQTLYSKDGSEFVNVESEIKNDTVFVKQAKEGLYMLQTEPNGQTVKSNIIYLTPPESPKGKVIAIYDITGRLVTTDYSGQVIIQYENGTYQRTYQ